MTRRAILLGLTLALLTGVIAFYNDAAIHQPGINSGFLPVLVVSALLLLAVAVNPLLGPRRALSRLELAVITALGLVAAAWPASNFFRPFAAHVAMPGVLIKDQPAWQAAHLLSYIPGASPDLAPGQVRDWTALQRALRRGLDPQAPPALRDLVRQLPPDLQSALAQTDPDANTISSLEEHRLVSALNDVINHPLLLDQSPWTGLSLPPPADRFTRARADHLDNARSLQARADALAAQRADLIAHLAPDLASLTARRQTLERQPHDARTHALQEFADQYQRLMAPVYHLDQQAKLTALRAQSHLRAARHLERFLNRLAVTSLLPDSLLPPPPHAGIEAGWLLAGGDEDPLATTMLTGGWDGPRLLPPSDLPWAVWRPTLLLWGALALLTALAGVLLATVVHPQWARHELLPYPLARFVGELTARAPGSVLPAVLRSKLFWLALGFVLFVHTLNGLSAWQIPFIIFPRSFPQFLSARDLLPDAVAVNAPMAWAVFIPQLFFAVIGLSFFLRTEVSLSLGLVGVAYLAMASFMYANGQAVEYNVAGAGNSNLVLFGAWLAGAIVVLYVGRGYYAAVLRGMLGLPRAAETPPTVIWAARGLLLCSILATGLLVQAGLDWIIAVPLVLLVLMVLMMIARINAETGAFLLLPEWYPAAILLAVAGDAAIGPTGYLLAGLVSAILVGEPTEAVTAMTANGLRMIDRAAETDESDSPIPHPSPPPTRLARTPLAMLAAAALAFLLLLVVVLTIQYNKGLNLDDKFATQVFPSRVPDVASQVVEELSARRQLAESNAAHGLQRLSLIKPRPGALGWISLGAALVLACAYARLRFAWWPLHPVVFMVMGAHPAMHMHYSFLLGWAIKASVVRLGGVRAARAVEPLMVGLIVGDILAMLLWALIGAAYYLSTGLYPPRLGTMLST